MTRSLPLSPTAFEPWVPCPHPHGVLVAARYTRAVPDEVVAASSARELALLGAIHPTRRGEWIAARCCSRSGLLHVGVVAPEVLSTDRGAPNSDSGHSVSLSHKSGLAVALVGAASGPTVGVDVEVSSAWDEDLARKVLTNAERIRAKASAAPGRFVLRLFSAKEAVYKAIDPVLRRTIEWIDVEVGPLREEDGIEFSDVIVRTIGAEPTLSVEAAWIHVGPFLVTTARARRS